MTLGSPFGNGDFTEHLDGPVHEVFDYEQLSVPPFPLSYCPVPGMTVKLNHDGFTEPAAVVGYTNDGVRVQLPFMPNSPLDTVLSYDTFNGQVVPQSGQWVKPSDDTANTNPYGLPDLWRGYNSDKTRRDLG